MNHSTLAMAARKTYDSDAVLELIERQGAAPNIPSKTTVAGKVAFSARSTRAAKPSRVCSAASTIIAAPPPNRTSSPQLPRRDLPHRRRPMAVKGAPCNSARAQPMGIALLRAASRMDHCSLSWLWPQQSLDMAARGVPRSPRQGPDRAFQPRPARRRNFDIGNPAELRSC